jgi:hypothetical protein
MSEELLDTLSPHAPVEKPEAEAPAEVPEKPEAPVSRRDLVAQAVEKNVTENADRPRDPATGKYVPAKQAKARHPNDKAAAAPSTPPAQTPTAQAVNPEQAAAPSRKPMPKSWKQDYAQKWEKLDPDMAEFLAGLEEKREKDVLSGIEQYKSAADFGRQLKQAIGPYEQMLQQYGGAAQGIGRLLQIQAFAAQSPQDFIKWFAQQRGINLSGHQAETPPEQQALEAALQPHLQRIAQLEGQLQQFTQSQEQAQQEKTLQAINSFLQGKELTPDLQEDYAAHIRAVRASNPELDDRAVLEKAYDNLSWANEGLRQKRLAEQENARKAKEAEELARKRAASVQVTGAPVKAQPSNVDPRNRRALIEQNLATAGRA